MDHRVRRRQRLRDSDGETSKSRHQKTVAGTKTKRNFLIGVTALGVLLVAGHFLGPSTSIQHQAIRFFDNVLPGPSEIHAVMMDAGSTGSRVLVFTFHKSDDGSLLLKDEFFKEVQPGISSYYEAPEKAAVSIQGLIDDAKAIVPQHKWSDTPMSLKATAGLRLLPEEVATQLLLEIDKVFANSGFLVHPESVSIINGTSEGYYLWRTINFLLGKTTSTNETVVVADMGGGSAQLAMIPLDASTLSSVPAQDVIPMSYQGNTTDFYIHSYLGMGLMAMRLTILRATNQSTHGTSNGFLSPYIPQGTKFTWEFQGKLYTLSGLLKNGSTEAYNQLRNSIAHLLQHSSIPQIDELRSRSLFAVSYFYDTAANTGLIVPKKLGGSVLVQEFCQGAKKVCTTPKTEQPFCCIDATYLCTLFESGFGLHENHVINLSKKIQGHETSWALGAALSDLEKHT